MLPEEIFVHRNLGNILHNRDLSSESALDWCLNLLKVSGRSKNQEINNLQLTKDDLGEPYCGLWAL